MLTQEADEEGFGRLSVAVPLQKHVKDNAMFVDGPP